MIDDPRNDRLDRLLEELGAEEPPPGLAQAIMARVNAFEYQRAQRRTVARNNGGRTMTRKAMWGLAAAAAVALAVFIVRGFPAIDRGTEGTVGAAKRYQAQQLTSKDVVVGDAQIQEFLQSDTFDRLMKDNATRNLLSNASVRAELSRPELMHALADNSVRGALTNRDVLAAFSDKNLRSELLNSISAGVQANVVKNAVDNASLNNAVRSGVIQQIMGDANLVNALQNGAVINALNNAEVRAALSAGYAEAALNSAALQNAINNPAFSNALKSNLIDAQLASGLNNK